MISHKARTKRLFLSFLFLSSITFSEIIKTEPQSPNTEEQSPVNILDTFIDEAKRQLDQTFAIFMALSSMINNNQIQTLHNKHDALVSIKQISFLLQKIQQEKFITVTDPSTIQLLFELNFALLSHLRQALEKGFTELKPFDPSVLITRTITPEEASLANFTYAITRNNILFSVVSQKADNVGLRWYNKAYRAFDRTIVEPAVKYSVPKRVFIGSALTFGAFWAWWKIFNDSFKKYTPNLIQKIYGAHPIYVGPHQIANENELSTLGKIDHMFYQQMNGLTPVSKAFVGFGLGLAGKEALEKLLPWTAKKASIITNKLKGGAYLKDAMRIANEHEDVTFDDLVGLEHVKKTFKQLVDYLENPEPFDRMGIKPPKGILLIGETRTGKSHSIRALSTEIKNMFKRTGHSDKEFSFISLPASLINSKGIAYLLSAIEEYAPCVVFIDEIDLLDLQRKGRNEMLSEFLTTMSGYLENNNSRKQVILIAATNRPETLDEALRQPGRFAKELRFEYPSFADRKQFISTKLDKLSLPLSRFNVHELAMQTEGKSFEALNMLINYGVLVARLRGQVLTQSHLEQILDEELRHVVTIDTRTIPEHQKNMLASHFAGHALALHLLGAPITLAKVTIRQVMTDIKEEFMGAHLWKPEDPKQKRYEYGSVFIHHRGDSINLYNREEKIALCKYHLAGIVAEELLLGACGYDCHNEDMDKALAIAKSIAFEGMNVAKLPEHIQQERYNAAFDLLNSCKEEMKALLEQHKEILQKLASSLQEKELLTAKEIADIIKKK